MSKTRPYSVTVGAAKYMIAATDRDQARRIALGGYPSPTVSVEAANSSELLEWMTAGNIVHTKDNFVPNIPATVVLFVDVEGRLATSEGMKLEPGNYFLQVEPLPEGVGGDDAGVTTVADAIRAANLPENQHEDAQPPSSTAERMEKLAADMDETRLPPIEERLGGDTLEQSHEQGMEAVAALKEFTPRTDGRDLVPPRYDGAFKGDKYCGDTLNPDLVTHLWDRAHGGWLLQEPYASDAPSVEPSSVPLDGATAANDGPGVDPETRGQD